MQAYAGNHSQLSKDQLKSILISHNVSLPPGDQRKAVYLQMYLKHIAPKDKESAEFSSDDEETMTESDVTPVEDQVESEEDKMDVKSLSNTELKEQLLKLGVKPGPILPSTRRVYENKLLQLIVSQVEENNVGHDQYSDNEDEGPAVTSQLEVNDNLGLINEMHSYSKKNVCSSNNMIAADVPATRRASLSEGFITRPAPGPYTHEKFTADKNTMTYRTPTNTPSACLFKKTSRQQSDTDATDPSDPISQSLLGMSATRRKPIKGAAGRPIQFKYDDLVIKARMQEKSKEASAETSKRLVPVPLQIALFAVVTFIAVLLYNMTGNTENPFVILSESQP